MSEGMPLVGSLELHGFDVAMFDGEPQVLKLCKVAAAGFTKGRPLVNVDARLEHQNMSSSSISGAPAGDHPVSETDKAQGTKHQGPGTRQTHPSLAPKTG